MPRGRRRQIAMRMAAGSMVFSLRWGPKTFAELGAPGKLFFSEVRARKPAPSPYGTDVSSTLGPGGPKRKEIGPSSP